ILASSFDLDGGGQPREQAAQRRLSHGGEPLLGVRQALLERLIAAAHFQGGVIELVAEGVERRRGPLDAPQRGRRGSPGTRRSDEAEGLAEVGPQSSKLA